MAGIYPDQATIAQQFTSLTRRAAPDTLVVQVGTSTPTLSMLMANNNIVTGGTSIIQPIQLNSITTTSATDYSGSFNIGSIQTGANNFSFTLKPTITPIPVLGMDALIQMDHDIVPVLAMTMNDAGVSTTNFWNTQLFQNATDNTKLIGLPAIYDDGTNAATYGGLSKATYPVLKGKVYNAAGANPTRQNVLQYIMGTTKNSGGEMPTFGVCNMGVWSLLSADFVGQEQYQLRPGSSFDQEGPRSGFTALMVGSVPIFADPSIPDTDDSMYLINTKYLSLNVHAMGAFRILDFVSMLALGQLGYVGAVFNVAELICTKPSTGSRITNFASATL